MEVVKVYVPDPVAVAKVYNMMGAVLWQNVLGDPNSNSALINAIRQIIKPRVLSQTTATTLILNIDNYDEADITSLASDLTIANPIGTPYNGQKLICRYKDNGTSRALALDTEFVDLVGIPSSTTISKVGLFGARWSAARSKWEIIATVTEP